MKKIKLTIIIVIIALIFSNSPVYAVDGTWIKEAFSAASTFLSEETTDSTGLLTPTFEFFQEVVKAINRILLVLLAGLSTIGLAVSGVKYIVERGKPDHKSEAQKSFHTVMIGMAFGFGAYTIWRIAMAIVVIVINAF